MHRIDTSTAQVDKFGAGKNGFTGGNPQTGELATALDADYFDSVQEELANVIEGAGLTLSKDSNSQLIEAINTLVGPGRLLNIQVITATGTYTKTPGTKDAFVKGVGGGAAGGGVGASTSSSVRGGAGGGAGTYGETWIDDVPDTVAVTIGAAGVGVSGNNGGNGGTSTFGSYLTLPGGNGGNYGINMTSAGRGAAGGEIATAATGSDFSIRGQSGDDAFSISATTVVAGAGASTSVGEGGSCQCSTSTTGTAFTNAGIAATGYGAGGGGATCGIGGAANVGGNGGPGIFIVMEFA
ncbi:MAG: hypothetical protein QM578_09685 [Pantoea sp.]|uniref:glycine-rich domain-containing protein n=1 Tax=Pantoea sp. TaxID=69393 RepID=UPI0039E65DCF